MRGSSRSNDGALRAVNAKRARRVLRKYGGLVPLALLVAVGCAAQEDGDTPGSAAVGNTPSAGSNVGGSASGAGNGASGNTSAGSTAGGSSNGGSSNGGSNTSGSANGGSAGAMAGAAGTGGSGGTANGGTGNGGTANGGMAGKGGMGGGSGAGGKGGSGGTSGAPGMGGTGGAPSDPCKDGKKDGQETDVDCGNACSVGCATNKGCNLVIDCVDQNVCDANKCRARGCNATNCAYDLTHFIIGTPTATSARGQVFVTWDATGLNLDYQVHDATVFDDSAENWKDDSVEVYLDLNHAKSTTYDADDFQINIPRTGTPQAIGAVNVGAITVTRTDDNKDYELKVKIPWSALNNAGSQLGKTIGFSIALNDDNNGDDRDTQVMLFGDGNNWMNASQLGDLQLK